MITAGARENALAALRQQRENIEAAERFLAEADPETVAMIQQAFSVNGNRQPEPAKPTPKLVPDGASTDAKPLRLSRGVLMAKVRFRSIGLRENITVHAIHQLLVKEGFRFGPGNNLVAIGVVLRKLKKRGLLEETRKASGRNPAVYRWVKREAAKLIS